MDAGVGNYTAKTFSKDRYTIWTMVSEYHNLPTIGNHTQRPGRQYEAKNVIYESDATKVKFELDLAGAYAKDAGLQQWRRRMTLDRKEGFLLAENFVFDQRVPTITLSLITPCRVDLSKAGIIQFLDISSGELRCQGTYDKDYWQAKVEDIPMNQPEDERVKDSWEKGLRRIILLHNNKEMTGEYSLKFY
ncbi:MAG: hypothetical protein HC892_00430 [Saprospiraceae bacterium]|nr:hypothetical protein [Saprospiraceae bacterium]